MASNVGYGPPSGAHRVPQRMAQHPHSPTPQPPIPHAPAPQPQPQAPPLQPQAPPPPPRAHASQAIDPGAWPIIRQSAAQLSRHRDAFVEQLHYDIKSLFPGVPVPDLWAFCDRMAQSLLWVALTDQPLGVVADALRQVGAQNWVEGFPENQYGNVAHALVQTVHYLSGNEWSASMGSVWISYFMWIKPHLIAGAEQAAEQYAAMERAAGQRAAEERAAAEREAVRVRALSRNPRNGQAQVVGDVNLESVGNLLDDEDDDDVGYGQLMVNMTRNRRDHPRHTSLARHPRRNGTRPTALTIFLSVVTISRSNLSRFIPMEVIGRWSGPAYDPRCSPSLPT
jgi:hypothetical protein